MVKIKQKGVYGVENPLPIGLSCGTWCCWPYKTISSRLSQFLGLFCKKSLFFFPPAKIQINLRQFIHSLLISIYTFVYISIYNMCPPPPSPSPLSYTHTPKADSMIFMWDGVRRCSARVCTNIHTHTHTYTHIHIHTLANTHTHTQTHTHTHSHTHTHILTHTHTHSHTTNQILLIFMWDGVRRLSLSLSVSLSVSLSLSHTHTHTYTQQTRFYWFSCGTGCGVAAP